MRKWRVGSISMGLSLVLLGILLFISQIKGTQLFEPLLMWWPLILIVLGIEILVYLFLAKQENPIVKYDFFSILFVGVIGTIGICITLLTSTGLLDEAQAFVGAEQKSINLPSIEEEITSEINRIVVETNNQAATIEGTDTNKLHVFGTYNATFNSNSKPPIQDKKDYSLTKRIGDTLYVTIKDPSSHSGLFSTYTSITPTIVVPNSIRLEVRGEHNSLSLYPGSLANDWDIEGAACINVQVSKKSDLLLSASTNNELENGNVKWDSITTNVKDDINAAGGSNLNRELYQGSLKLGNGTYHVTIFNSDTVSVNLVE